MSMTNKQIDWYIGRRMQEKSTEQTETAAPGGAGYIHTKEGCQERHLGDEFIKKTSRT